MPARGDRPGRASGAGDAARVLAGAIALAASCAPSPEIAVLETSGATAMLLVDVRGAEVDVTAYVLDGAILASVPTSADANVHRFALLYGCALDALGLAAGKVTLTEGTGRALPLSERTLELPPMATRWGELAARPAILDAIHIADPGGDEAACLDFEVVGHPIPGTTPASPVTAVVALDETTALAATIDGRFFRASRAGVTQVTGLDPVPPHLAAFQGDGDEVWLVSGEGTVMHGNPSRGFVRGPDFPDLSTRCLLVSRSPLDQPLEVFALTCHRRVWHFDGTTWTLIDEAPGEPLNEGGIAWIGPGAAVAAGPDQPALSFYEDGAKHLELSELAAGEVALSVSLTPALGLLAGTTYGNVFRRVGEAWTPLSTSLSTRSVRAIFPIPNGALFGGPAGHFTQYQADHGRCDQRISVAGSLSYATMLGETIASVGNSADDEVISFITPLPKRTVADHCPEGQSP